MARQEPRPLRRGWTTGACAAAAAWAAYAARLAGKFSNPATIRLPRGQKPAFPLALAERGTRHTRAGIVKDAGEDPDLTHSAMIGADVASAEPGSGVAGEGVGTAAAGDGDTAGAGLDVARPWRPARADGVARRVRDVALATLSGAIAVKVAIFGHSGEFLARVGAGAPPP